jgi:hypothetical protein
MNTLTDEMIEAGLAASGLRLQPGDTLNFSKGTCCPIGAACYPLLGGFETRDPLRINLNEAHKALGIDEDYALAVARGFDGKHNFLKPRYAAAFALGKRWRARWQAKVDEYLAAP